MRAKKKNSLAASKAKALNKSDLNIPEINLSESDTSSDEENLGRPAHISKSEYFYDEDGDLHIVLSFSTDESFDNTAVTLSVGEFGVSETKIKVASDVPQKIDSESENNHSQEKKNIKEKSSSPTLDFEIPIIHEMWESPSKILKESFGKLNVNGSNPNQSPGSSQSSGISGNFTKKSKKKKFRRIVIVSSSSDSEDSIQPQRNSKKAIILSSSESDDSLEEKKPRTRKETPNIGKNARDFGEEDVLNQVYRFEGIYWEYEKGSLNSFNCFECSKNKILNNLIDHFVNFHSELIAVEN